jgi:predicted amidohydrolase
MNRRKANESPSFLEDSGRATVAQAPRFDILIHNGTVCDPAARRNAIAGEKIPTIHERNTAGRGAEVVDARVLYVTAGPVDLHTHCCGGATTRGFFAKPIATPSGLATWVDVGSFGVSQGEGFRNSSSSQRRFAF